MYIPSDETVYDIEEQNVPFYLTYNFITDTPISYNNEKNYNQRNTTSNRILKEHLDSNLDSNLPLTSKALFIRMTNYNTVYVNPPENIKNAFKENIKSINEAKKETIRKENIKKIEENLLYYIKSQSKDKLTDLLEREFDPYAPLYENDFSATKEKFERLIKERIEKEDLKEKNLYPLNEINKKIFEEFKNVQKTNQDFLKKNEDPLYQNNKEKSDALDEKIKNLEKMSTILKGTFGVVAIASVGFLTQQYFLKNRKKNSFNGLSNPISGYKQRSMNEIIT